RDLDQPAQQLHSQAPLLERIADQNGEFRFRLRGRVARHFHQPAHSHNVLAMDSYQRDLAVVVDEAYARQPLVRDALIELHRMEIAEVHTALGKLLMETDHERLVFRTNRPDGHRRAVFCLPDPAVVRRVGPDSRPGKTVLGEIWTM